MPIPSPEAFRSELDELTPAARSARVREIALAGAACADDAHDAGDAVRGDFSRLADALAAGSAVERRIAASLAQQAGDVARVLRAARDPDATVRWQALGWLARKAPADSVGPEFLAGLPADDQARFVRVVAVHDRRDVAEALLAAAESSSVALACRLLPACSDATVRAALPRLGFKTDAWSLLTRRHPDAVIDWIEGLFGSWPWRTRASIWTRFAAPLARAARERPDRVLSLVERHAPVDAFPLRYGTHVAAWMRSHADRVGALLLEPGRRAELLRDGLPPKVRTCARRFGDATLAALAGALASDERKLAELLCTLPPSRRAVVFSAVQARLSPDHHWSAVLLDALPHAIRDREAARIAALDTVRSSVPAIRAMLTRMGTAEAEAALMEQTRAGDPDERCAAKVAVVTRAGLTGAGRAAALDLVERSRSEREPVRAELLAALAAWPLRALGAADLAPALGAVLRHAVTAFDASGGTQSVAARIALRILQAADCEVSGESRALATEILRLVATKASVRLAWLGAAECPERVLGVVWTTVRDVLAAESARGEFEAVLEIATTFGRRMPPGMLPLLEAAFRSPATHTAQRAAELLLLRREGRLERLLALAAADPTVVASGPPRTVASHARPDLLLPLLDGDGPPGRFLSTRPWVPWWTPGWRGWSPRVLGAVRARFFRVAADTSRPAAERALALRTCSGIPCASAQDFIPFLASEDPAIAMAAASAIGRSGDADAARATLVRLLDGDHAIPASAALRRIARALPPPAAQSFLTACLAEPGLRLTPKRLLLRTAVELGGDALFDCAGRAATAADAHRDVACGVLAEASRRLPEPRAWDLVERIALRPEREIAATIAARAATDLDPAARRRYAALVVRVASHEDAATRCAAFAAFDRWADGNDVVLAEAAAARVTRMEPGADAAAAQQALVKIACGGEVCDVLAATFDRLLGIDAARAAALPGDDTSATRDRPALRRARDLLVAVGKRHDLFRQRMAPALAKIAARLEPDFERTGEWAEALLANASWTSPPTIAAALGRIADRVAAHPLLAVRLAFALDGRRAEIWKRGDVTPAVVLGIARDLAARNAAGAWLAVDLVSRAGQRTSWDAESRAALLALRRHSDAAVRSAATAVRVATE